MSQPKEPKEPESPAQLRERLGRPSLLTADRQQHIVRLVRAGSYLNVAAQHAGIGRSTLMSWLARGRAAAAARDAHNPDRLYCPGCDLDRTDAVAAEQAVNDAEGQRYQEALNAWQQRTEPDPSDEPPTRAYAVLENCPACRSSARPAPFELPDEELRYLDFLDAVTRADTEAEVTAATAWRAAFTSDWRAARDYLVRRHPDRWAATTRIAINSEEAEQRIDRAVGEVLAVIGGDGDPLDLPPELDLDSDSTDL